jgi:hypothetical protein
MIACANCLSSLFATATYDSPDGNVRLPALVCSECGCLELDDGRIHDIQTALQAPELLPLYGRELRDAVQRVLAGMRLGTCRTSMDMGQRVRN